MILLALIVAAQLGLLIYEPTRVKAVCISVTVAMLFMTLFKLSK